MLRQIRQILQTQLTCDKAEKGPSSDEFSTVPQMTSAEMNSDVDFYARYLLDAANGDVQDTGDAASLDQAVRDGDESDDTDALLTPAYTFLETVAKTSDNNDFAQHASLAHGKLSMASVCSTP